MKIQIINGPNLNLLGRREPGVYGTISMEDYLKELNHYFKDVDIQYYQSNIEGEIIDKIHQVSLEADGIILNAGGYTHTSVSIADAIRAIKTPVIEVHISNIFAREEYRHVSLIGPYCQGCISGFGMDVYRLGILSFIDPK
jgi:3-dehydroquinate dehydratase-2